VDLAEIFGLVRFVSNYSNLIRFWWRQYCHLAKRKNK